MPMLSCAVACRGGEAAALAHLESGLQRDSDGPSRGEAGDVGLIDPSASEIQAGGNLAEVLFQRGGRTGFQPFGGGALQYNVFDASLLAKLTFCFGGAVFVDHKDIGLQPVDSTDEVHHAVAVVDEGVFHVTDGLHHEEALLFGIERLMVFVVQDSLVGADAHIEVAILRRLAEELNVPAVEEVVASRHKDFLVHRSARIGLFKKSA